MRNPIALGMLLLLGACSIFGTDPPPAPDPAPTPPPQDPATNATPPVTGAPLVGVFVSSSHGRDEASGNSSSEALKTLAAAIQKAKERRQRVLACAETYTESVVLADGVSMFGSFDCSTVDAWRPSNARARVNAPTSPALVATGITQETRLDGFEIAAPSFDLEEPSDAARSSIGAAIRGATGLTIASSILRAGAGGRGKDGAEGKANAELRSAAQTAGGAAVGPGSSDRCPFLLGCGGETAWGGAGGGTSMCATGAAGGPGGRGGDGQFLGGGGLCAATDVRGQPYVATSVTAGGSIGYCQEVNAGGPRQLVYGGGSRGTAGADGPDGANGAWTFSATREFVPGQGSAGKDGSPGQGGGGGGAASFNKNCAALCPNGPRDPKYQWSGAGGGGGAGGCAGLAGAPGSGGGASIGAIVIDSQLSVIGTRIESAAGGAAGKGSLGSAGLVGADGGNYATDAGYGGSGGNGGAGGLSGHGAPGPSIALAYAGTRPRLEESPLVPGPGGAGQAALAKSGHALAAVEGASLPEHKL